MKSFSTENGFNEQGYREYRRNLLFYLSKALAENMPPHINTEKRRWAWLKERGDLAESIHNTFSEIDFDSDPIQCEPLVGRDLKAAQGLIFDLSVILKRDVQFSGNGMIFSISHKDKG